MRMTFIAVTLATFAFTDISVLRHDIRATEFIVENRKRTTMGRIVGAIRRGRTVSI